MFSRDKTRYNFLQQPNWYHFTCFFGKCRPKTIDDIGKFHNLRWDDQEKIRAQVERNGSVGTNGKSSSNAKLVSKSLADFVVQYALSNRSKCRKCEEKIEKVKLELLTVYLYKLVLW